MTTAKRCKVFGCEALAVANEMCDKHRKRVERHGDVDAGRPDDWGRSNSPLNAVWKSVMRYHREDYPPWTSFSAFCADIQPPPSGGRRFAKLRQAEPYGPSNWFWQAIDVSPESSDKRKARVEAQRRYQQKLRAANPEYFRDKDLKKLYGVDLVWYEATYQAQGGLCAICRKPETAEIRGAKLRLAVDHCHGSGKVRGLLCRRCNNGIGHFNHDIAILQDAIKYLAGS